MCSLEVAAINVKTIDINNLKPHEVMKQVKVKQTETYKDSQGEHIVCKGKLVFIYEDKQYPPIGAIGSNNVHPLFMWTENHSDMVRSGVLTEYKNTKWIKPIIISETEEIEIGDKYIHLPTNTILEKGQDKEAILVNSYKILALPENFSPKHLQAIIDGKLKDGDEVLIECKNMKTYNDLYPHKSNMEFHDNYFIKLSNDNHIKLFPINKEESWDNIRKHCFSSRGIPYSNLIFRWLEDNYLPPKRK